MAYKIRGFRKIIGILTLLTCFLFSSAPVLASDEHEIEHKEEKFNAGKLIIEHISDSHDWHLWGHTSIPLPVIVYSKDKGLDVFSSSRFEHGHATYNGYALKENHIVAVNDDGTENEEATASIWDLSITKNTASLLISVILMLFLFISIARAYAKNPNKAPKGMQSLLEPIIIFVRDDVAKASIGRKYERYMPFLLTVFFFIWINNLMGIIPIFPGGTNLTGNIAITMCLAVFTFLITTFSANKHYWQHIFAMPGVPKWVLFLLTPIEILGVFLRPFVLMIRLFANMLAGHIIALSFFSLIFIFGEMNAGVGLGVSVVSLAFTIFMTVLELLVAFLQAYVFTLLSAIYFGAAVEEHHHDEHHEEKQALI
jgi:F-type H+-transporting ATPase subunit a